MSLTFCLLMTFVCCFGTVRKTTFNSLMKISCRQNFWWLNFCLCFLLISNIHWFLFLNMFYFFKAIVINTQIFNQMTTQRLVFVISLYSFQSRGFWIFVIIKEPRFRSISLNNLVVWSIFTYLWRICFVPVNIFNFFSGWPNKISS